MHTTPPSLDDIADMAERALAALPPSLSRHVQGLAILVEDAADDDTLADMGIGSVWDLTGLYQGVPRHLAGQAEARHQPDRIVLFREPILLEWIEEGEDLPALVRHVLIHEIAHHLGFSDADIEAIENAP